MHYYYTTSPVPEFLCQVNHRSTERLFYFESTFVVLTLLAYLNPLSLVRGGENNTDFHNERILASHILFSDR